jgi:hypothetical protein
MPPKELDNDAAVLAVVADNPNAIGYVNSPSNAIGYVNSPSVTGAVKVISLN